MAAAAIVSEQDVQRCYNEIVARDDWQFVRQYNTCVLVAVLSRIVEDTGHAAPSPTSPEQSVSSEQSFGGEPKPSLLEQVLARTEQYFDRRGSEFRGSHCHDISMMLCSAGPEHWLPACSLHVVPAPYDKPDQRNSVHFACCIQTEEDCCFFADPTFSVDASLISESMGPAKGLGRDISPTCRHQNVLSVSKGKAVVRYLTPSGIKQIPEAKAVCDIDQKKMRSMVTAHLLAPPRGDFFVSRCNRKGTSRPDEFIKLSSDADSGAWRFERISGKERVALVTQAQLEAFLPPEYAQSCALMLSNPEHGKKVMHALKAVSEESQRDREALLSLFASLGDSVREIV
eukprot:Amastigsp_a176098_5.p1 type:complete len:343 gc:universal Amastigsp_a176098_5:1326-298(-)